MSTPVRILTCDDHSVVRAGLRLILDPLPDFQIAGEAASAEELLDLVERWRPDVVLMDLSMPGMGGLEAIARIRQAVPEVKILVFTVHADEAYFFRALKAGADGYVLKGASSDELVAALHLVAQGGVAIPRALGQRMMTDYLQQPKGLDADQMRYEQLLPAERAVMRQIATGRTNKEIAQSLSVSPRTVERYRTSLMKKLGLHNRTQLVQYALRRGILEAS
jgi:two-component system, NarL family, response regulator NreC